MGAGKSTVASRVGDRLALPVVDLDREIEKRAGKSVSALFATEGEAGFRQRERDLALELSRDNVVMALGGGAVLDTDLRHALIDRGVVVTLTAPVEVLAQRVGHDHGRPLLGDDPTAALEAIVAARASVYAECHATVDTSAVDTDQAADAIVGVALTDPVLVPLGLRSYRVEIGRGVRCLAGRRSAELGPSQVIVVHDGGPERPWPGQVIEYVSDAGLPVMSIAVDGTEATKTVGTVETIWDRALEHGIDRQAALLAVGGGVVGDLSAFAASTLLRGIAFGQIPTTLLSMVDSSVGGKTGFNRAQGKNLVGTFYQPRFVLCDVDTLGTLDDDERTAGMAEVVKSAWLAGPEAVTMLEQDADALRAHDPEATIRAVRMSVRLKAQVVRRDERESGHRMLLNLGHTVGHAIEAAADYQGVRHGEAVSLGMVAAITLSRALGHATQQDRERLVGLLGRLGLPTDVAPHLTAETLSFVGADKKRRGAQIRFVMPSKPGHTVVQALPTQEVTSALLGG